MLILLPPSEGKTPPQTGTPLDLDTLSVPGLTASRSELIDALVKLCSDDPQNAATILKLGPKQADDVNRNADLWRQPSVVASTIYTGVLFTELGIDSLPGPAVQHLNETTFVCSALFGLVSLRDQIPAYRLSAGITLPGIGTIARHWRPVLGPVIDELADGNLVLDLRSGSYVNLGKPPKNVASASLRVLTERDGKRSVVSHFNKATKGQIVRQLVTEQIEAATVTEFATALGDLGWRTEINGIVVDVVLAG